MYRFHGKGEGLEVSTVSRDSQQLIRVHRFILIVWSAFLLFAYMIDVILSAFEHAAESSSKWRHQNKILAASGTGKI